MRISPWLLIALAGCSGAEAATAPKAEDPAVAVRLAKVEHGPIARPIRGTGVLRLKSEIDLSFKVGGLVSAVSVEEGARVRRGQVLARLDPTEVDAALRQAKEGATKAERDLERVRKLHASGAIAIVEVQNAETAFALAEAGTNAAAFNAQRSVIVAPDDGRVDKRLVEPGEVVAPGRAVLHMSGQSKGAIVRIGVTDRDVLRIHEGDPARVVLDADPTQVHDGKVTQVATVATAGAGTFEVEVKLASPPKTVLSGLTAKVEIAHLEDAGAVVPAGAVTFGPGDESAVYVVDAGRARRVPVKVAFLDGARIALASTLEGAEVVEAGASRLADGTSVRIVP
ncbi:MAG: efflux RND transporter periplasmic adaptor subunit [Labilithrix sp.]|nr:efflux RND transporter periplasmic adaptor subunit [Labilithrix sp.]MCW5812284.1 efflux RND transporter periplasmic adaptor subunit [Labilithrix sp.]